ncbi:MAG: D-alanyl-D-alanine carboxypeptidase [Oscillospiraceae bacterium]|nr:D-alanyl-D-alanine carboxypeptidase [Oscillospiraceae bacterium]
MKKLVHVFLTAAVLYTVSMPVLAVETAPAVSAECSIVIHADSGRVLYEKNADQRMLIASTTKIMTALVALENCAPEEAVTIKPEWAAVEGSSMYLKSGETYTLEELLYGMMLASGNDAATAVACHVAGDIPSFAELMNEKAEALGMSGSSFENPHGLDGETHYSTARDMATLAAHAMENESFAKIVGTHAVTIKGLTYVNHNKLLTMCDGVLGVKTGFTKAAGRTLVSCCERDGARLICVTLHAPDDWDDHMALYDWAYREYRYMPAVGPEDTVSLPLISDAGGTVTVRPREEVRVLTAPEDQVSVSVQLPRFVFPGHEAGERAGKLIVCVNGVPQGETDYVYCSDIAVPTAAKRSFLQWLRGLGVYELIQ